MKPALSVIKIGGNIIEDSTELSRFLSSFSRVQGPKILVHGGGKKATSLSEKLGIKPSMVKGRRITDAQALEVAIMVYAGLVNKTIVSKLQALQCNALGLSGADAAVIKAIKRPVKSIDYGFAGDIVSIRTKTLLSFLETGLVPVFCALTDDGQGQLLNTNADTIASELAIALSSEYRTTLYYCFEKPGVLANVYDEASVISHINKQAYYSLLREKQISEGMLPKLENCFHALDHSVHKVCIGDITMLQAKSSNFTTLTL
ncbi:acetylglutamate kinase [Muriicola soli]|uniref:Acetylglutamate kinase n=1 Tax=Muriicola soli TaxID=2507538 RepID=A0A411EBE0_9FLAO|nr:acetylglutamate kinase [Muriicola soli]QBA65045.1 acetylglutamate kinase [Muriicola soli]